MHALHAAGTEGKHTTQTPQLRSNSVVRPHRIQGRDVTMTSPLSGSLSRDVLSPPCFVLLARIFPSLPARALLEHQCVGTSSISVHLSNRCLSRFLYSTVSPRSRSVSLQTAPCACCCLRMPHCLALPPCVQPPAAQLLRCKDRRHRQQHRVGLASLLPQSPRCHVGNSPSVVSSRADVTSARNTIPPVGRSQSHLCGRSSWSPLVLAQT